MAWWRMTVPCLGPGECVVITDEPAAAPEKGEVIYTKAEIDIMWAQLEKDSWTDKVKWIRYLDAVKRMYTGAVVKSLVPLQIDHPELTPEKLERFPWQMLPRR